MTLQPTNGQEVANWSSDDMSGLGLEDASDTDIVIPRLNILHNKGLFQNNLTKAEWPALNVIMLGLVKQRIMWHTKVEDGDKPQCKSPNFLQGFPNSNEETKKEKRFPWAESNFNSEDFPSTQGVNGLTTLPCESCVFTQWGADRSPPKCSEQHTYPLLYSDPADPENWMAAILTVQRTGIKPSRSYLSAFVQANKPMFTVYTQIGLTQASRGTVEYSVPTFKTVGPSDQNRWMEYANRFRTIRDFVKSAPRNRDEDDHEGGRSRSNVNTAPVSTPDAPLPSAPPVQAAPAAPVMPQAPAPSAAPPPPVPNPTPPVPVTENASPVPVVSVPATPEDDDDLPF